MTRKKEQVFYTLCSVHLENKKQNKRKKRKEEEGEEEEEEEEGEDEDDGDGDGDDEGFEVLLGVANSCGSSNCGGSDSVIAAPCAICIVY